MLYVHLQNALTFTNEMNWPEQFGGGEESSPSDWQTTTSSSSVIYPSKHEYVYVSRYVRFRSAGTSSVKAPFSGTGHVIAVIESFVILCKRWWIAFQLITKFNKQYIMSDFV